MLQLAYVLPHKVVMAYTSHSKQLLIYTSRRHRVALVLIWHRALETSSSF